LHRLCLEKTYNTPAENIFNLFKDLTVFRLTGADIIDVGFKPGGKFTLNFNDRGIIHGDIQEITENKKIVLNWNVEGFGREPEVNTEVIFHLTENNGACSLKLEHNNIMYSESFEAKKRAWSEILEDMENELK
jgi:uncharacterized protein YndB with AHSA1/START domain